MELDIMLRYIIIPAIIALAKLWHDHYSQKKLVDQRLFTLETKLQATKANLEKYHDLLVDLKTEIVLLRQAVTNLEKYLDKQENQIQDLKSKQ